MNGTNAATRLILIGCLLWTAAVSPALNEPGPDEQTTNQIAELTSRIERAFAENDRLKKVVDEATAGMRPLIERRLREVQTSGVTDINTLAELVVSQEKEGVGLDGAREQVADWLELLPPALIRHIEKRMVIVEELASRAETESTKEKLKVEMKIVDTLSQIVSWHGLLHRSSLNMHTLGMDATTVRNYLEAELQELAALLVVAIELNTEEMKALRFRLSLTPDKADLQTELRVVEFSRGALAQHLGATSDLLRQLGIDSSEYESLVVQVTGELSANVLRTSVVSALLNQWGRDIWNWITNNGLNLLFKLVVFVLILFAARALSKLTRRGIERAITSVNLSKLLKRMIVGIAANTVFILGVLIAVSQLGVALTPFLAGLGVAGFIIGFALQDTLGNFASGMMILIYRPYDVGDVIEAGGVYGKVDRMSLVSTVILTFDNQKLVVPNSKIWGDVIRNVTAQRIRRVDLTFGVSYQDDIPKAERVLREIVTAHDCVLDDPAPMIKVHSLGDSSVDFIVRPWVRTDDYWDVYWDITREVKMRFDAEGISIPFPQRQVHFAGVAAGELSPPELNDAD